MTKRTLSCAEWHRLAQQGTELPMRIQIHGVSMFPLIRMDRDYVTLIPLTEPPQVGDIVLFADAATDRYVLHRVWALRDDAALTWGDNCSNPDGWQPLAQLWGKVIKIERSPRIIIPSPRRGMCWACVWHILGRIYRRVRSVVKRWRLRRTK